MNEDLEKMLSEEESEETTETETKADETSYEEIVKEKVRIEQELEKQKKNNEELRKQRDRFANAKNTETVKDDEDIIFNKLGAVKKDEFTQTIDQLKNDILTQIGYEKTVTQLKEQVEDYSKKYPFIEEATVKEYLSRNPRSSVEEAMNATYGRKMTQFDYESNSEYPFGDNSETEMDMPKTIDDVPISDRRKFTSAIKNALLRKE